MSVAELDSQPKSIQSIYTWFSENKLFVNRRYQRKLVWTLDEKQKLVESVLKKYPIPAILLAERDTGGYEIIDGLQRLHTLMSFIETGFATLDGEYFDITGFPTAKLRANEGLFSPTEGNGLITQREVSTFLDYSMAISIMRGATEAEIDDVFARINTYGHRLSDQERRQAGVQDEFSDLIRELACEIRGDASSDILTLDQMPSISVDLPMTKHEYSVVADETFWVRQGILRSTDLRDSMDEQCLADMTASIISGSVIERSKDTLDGIYEDGSSENDRITAALDAYGKERFANELKHCIDELLQVCESGTPDKLRGIIFSKPSSNAFPAVFAILIIALHESLVGGQRKVASYGGIKGAITGLYDRLNTKKGSTSPEERRKNIDIIKGLIASYLVESKVPPVYGAYSTTDIDSTIRRSEIELPHYELKQGLLRLDASRAVDDGVIDRIIRTICAIANNGKKHTGSIVIGVTDKEADAERVKQLYGTEPRKLGSRFVVGVKREAAALGEKPEQYFARLKSKIRNSTLSEPLRGEVLSNMDYNDYYGLGLIMITIPTQRQWVHLFDRYEYLLFTV